MFNKNKLGSSYTQEMDFRYNNSNRFKGVFRIRECGLDETDYEVKQG